MPGYGFAIDRGGTFTDICVFRPDNSVKILKILSEDPANYKDAPTEAIRRVLEEETKTSIPKGTPVPMDNIAWIRMGTTVATNALLERKGERIALLVTRGFKDLLFIGNQDRPKIFELNIKVPEVLYEEVVEVDERVIPVDKTCKMELDGKKAKGTTGQEVIVEQEVDREAVKKSLEKIWEKGIRSIAVVFLHSFMFPDHELEIRKVAKEVGFKNVSLSHEVMPMIKIVPRGFTVSADAYLTPKILDYIHGFESGFADGLKDVRVHFMQSDGGLCDVNRFSGSKAILSGPAGGVVGIANTAYSGDKPVIGFDMGGTSTDVCRYSGALEHVMETTTAGVTIQAPQLDIQTVAAGGGSRLFFKNGLFVVGPESAGAHPGPVCYKKDGHLAVTDANLVLGRIVPDYFPKIFGPEANEALDKESAVKAMTELTEEINKYMKEHPDTNKKEYTVEEVALGFIDVANEAMCRPVRSLTQARGFDTSNHILASFGGAGGQHACAVARVLGIKKVRINKYCSLLSAYGIALADVVSEVQQPLGVDYQEENFQTISTRLDKLATKAHREVKEQGFPEDRVRCEYYLHMRFQRTDCAIMITGDYKPGDKQSLAGYQKNFIEAYKREFGFVLEKRNIIVDDVRVRGIGESSIEKAGEIEDAKEKAVPKETRKVYYKGGAKDTNVYFLKDLLAGHEIQGPALIIDATSTIVIEPQCSAVITKLGDIEIDVEKLNDEKWGTEIDPIRLAIFSNRFMSIAEQMGRILHRTAISTNIKERLDFSCALFSPDGGLIANAPHIPVHLGGMQYSVKFQIEHNGLDGIKDGDVFLSNHPLAGGSHLPDFTVITPVFFEGIKHPVFFLANRGHHADIGGLSPGSMPPNATDISQEGAAFVSFKLVKEGNFNEEELTEELVKKPSKAPGCSGTRNLSDNISDLKAQIAANNKGISLVCDLIKEYSLDVVQAYMQHIQKTAEESVRAMLKKIGEEAKERLGKPVLHAVDFMDDGTQIELTVTIDIEKGEAEFDFTGTGVETFASCNTPRAVSMSAIIYCLRCLIGKDIPLNSGCLAPIKISIPEGSILSPSPEAAVVGGNVLTSQRLCDVVFRAFEAAAASQGCMNNLTFGDESMGYYETIAGGAGAGDGYNGRSGIHTHMTNTRITDPEILESRYPVILREFAIREGSGGAGKFKGGDGVIRRLQFRRPLSLSLLTERRAFEPYGLKGGCPGKRGLNLLTRGKRTASLASKQTLNIQPGDILELKTPGGGGYGSEENEDKPAAKFDGLLLFMLPVLLLLLVAETTSLNPLCDQRKGQAPENVNAPADYIFIFDQGLIQDKSERWRYVVKAMTCNLMEHTDVNLAVAEKKGDNIDFDQWEKPSRFESRLLRVKGNAGGDESSCPTASSLYGLPIEPNRPTHLVVLVDTDRADDCVDLDTDFSRIFHNTEIVLDRIHIGAPLASDNLKITQHWGDIDTAVSTLPDDHSFANLANQDTHESLQDQISNWIAGRLPLTLRRSLKNESTPIVATIDSTVDVTTADYSTTENLTTVETITIATSNGTRNETLETTVVTIIGVMTNETTTMDPETNSTWENGTATTQEGPAEMVIAGSQNRTTEANKTPTSTPTPLMNTNSTASSTTEKAGSWTSEAWQWIAREYILLLLLLLALILIIVNIILLCCVICTCRKRDKERRGKNKYQSLGGNLYSTKEKEEKTLSGSDSDTVVVPVPEEKRALLDEISEMQATQTNTDNVKKDTISPATQPLSLPLPSTEPPSSMRHDREAAPENPLPVPHPAEGAVDPYSPPLPSPFEVRHSDVALTPVRTVSSFTQRGPQRDQQPLTALLQKKASSPKRPDVFDL